MTRSGSFNIDHELFNSPARFRVDLDSFIIKEKTECKSERYGRLQSMTNDTWRIHINEVFAWKGQRLMWKPQNDFSVKRQIKGYYLQFRFDCPWIF
jgi:hypothetical protein